MTAAKRTKISVRLDDRVHADVRRIVNLHPRRALTQVVEQLLRSALKSDQGIGESYSWIAVSHLSAVLDILTSIDGCPREALVTLGQLYSMLLERAITIEGEES